MNYEEKQTALGDSIIVRNNKDGSVTFIPKDESNSDYQRYLRYLAGEEENEILP